MLQTSLEWEILGGRGQTGENPLWGVMDIFWVPHVTMKATLISDRD